MLLNRDKLRHIGIDIKGDSPLSSNEEDTIQSSVSYS